MDVPRETVDRVALAISGERDVANLDNDDRTEAQRALAALTAADVQMLALRHDMVVAVRKVGLTRVR